MPPLPPPLPHPRRAGRYAVGVVCLGNICRSPIADVVIAAAVADAGLDDVVSVASGGTGGWHVGEPMDQRSAAVLHAIGLDPDGHRAHQVDADWLAACDLVLAMDAQNLVDLRSLMPDADSDADPSRLMLFGDLDPVDPGADVPDPYYGGSREFEEVLEMVERTAEVLVAALPAVLEAPAGQALGDR